MKRKGIICIESEFQLTTENLKLTLNTKPLLDFLEHTYGIPYIYRMVATEEELAFYLKKLHKKEFDNYEVFYFSSHGETQQICLGNGDSISLDRFAELADGVFENRYVHFSSCRTLLGSDKKLEEFKQSTGAKMVSGYTKSVDQGLSAIHDIALMQQIIDKSQRATIIKNIEKLYSGLGQKLGFKCV